jgi:hypothetical protein
MYPVVFRVFESRQILRNYNLLAPGQYPGSEVSPMVAGHVLESRGSREFHRLILRRVRQMEGIASKKFLELLSEVENKTE